GVAEEVRRVDQADLLHLVGGEGEQRGDVAKALHRASYLRRASSAARRSAARATRASASARVAARAVMRTRRSQSGAKAVARDLRWTPGTAPMTRSTATVMTDSSPEPEATSRSTTWAGAPRHARRRGRAASKIGRASCRERVEVGEGGV